MRAAAVGARDFLGWPKDRPPSLARVYVYIMYSCGGNKQLSRWKQSVIVMETISRFH